MNNEIKKEEETTDEAQEPNADAEPKEESQEPTNTTPDEPEAEAEEPKEED